MLYKQFYSELGKLLYAFADSDGNISKTEKKALHDLINKDLAPLKNGKDEFGTSNAFYTEFEFDIMEDSILEPEAAFESFISFVEEHKTAIDKRLIKVTRKVAAKLAESYYHTNKKEKQLLMELDKKLDFILKEKK